MASILQLPQPPEHHSPTTTQKKKSITFKNEQHDQDSDNETRSSSGASSADLSSENNQLEHTVSSSFSNWNESSSDGEHAAQPASMIASSDVSKVTTTTTSSTTASSIDSTNALKFGLKNMRRKRMSERNRALKSLEESKWLLELIWRATNNHKNLLEKRELTPSATATPRHAKLIRQGQVTTTTSSSMFNNKYKVVGGLTKPTPIGERLVSTDSLFGAINQMAAKFEAEPIDENTAVGQQEKLIIKLKIMLSKKWAKDGEMITWTPLDQASKQSG